MSFILDALRKAQSQRDEQPSAASLERVAPPTKKRWKTLTLSALVLANASVLGWVAMRSGPPPTAVNVVQTSAAIVQEPIPVKPPEFEPIPLAHPSVIVAEAHLDAPQPGRSTDTLSGLSLDILVYGDKPAQRFVLINGNRYRQGDWIDNDILLEEIVPTGAVLNFRGERIQLNVSR